MKPNFHIMWVVLSILCVVNLTAQNLPNSSTDFYAASGVCALCHSGLRDSSGDVSITTDWESTMMANAASREMPERPLLETSRA